ARLPNGEAMRLSPAIRPKARNRFPPAPQGIALDPRGQAPRRRRGFPGTDANARPWSSEQYSQSTPILSATLIRGALVCSKHREERSVVPTNKAGCVTGSLTAPFGLLPNP